MSEAQATATKSGAPDPLLGRVIADRFKIVSLIARGGMGKVYRAEQSPLGRLCAIKILNPNYNGDADPEFHRRFYREASITSKITHPNSVTIFDYGRTDDDVYYMAMEYLEGQTLHQALRDRGVIPEDRAGRIASQICRAVREAHALGVIHRDLKPANIFLTRHGDDEDFVKVLDFGLVKHLSERPEEQLTQTGLFMGSPKYMAPEQIQGGVVDARTDIYSLGIMLYEMLAGKVPFERATSVNILMAHVGEAPPPMRAINPNLVCSPAFEEIVMRSIAKDPNQRPASMDEVLLAIKRAHGGALTGQLMALNAAGLTGPFAQMGSGNSIPVAAPSLTPSGSGGSGFPPGLVAPWPGSGYPPSPAASGAHTPMAIQQPDASSNIAFDAAAMRPRSRAWILVGVVLAAVVGGGLGMLAFRMTAPAGTAATQRTASESSVAPVVADPTTPSTPSTPATESAPLSAPSSTTRVIAVRVTSDPPGASVKEDTNELCASTPCDVTFKGDTADPGKTPAHQLVVAKAGYRSETRSVDVGKASANGPLDPMPLNVKLVRVGGGGTVRNHGASPSTPSTPSTSGQAGQPATPSGFKDLPY